MATWGLADPSMEVERNVPEIDAGDSVLTHFEAIAAAQPESDAIRSRGQVWRYSKLNRIANNLAHALLALPHGGDAPVALLFDHHAPVIAAILGVLKAGKCYVCLDSTFPVHRNEAILRDVGSRLVLCDHANLSFAAALVSDGQSVLVYEDIYSGPPSVNPGIPVSAGMALGIFYTSGSTGDPKGVLWRHDICLHRMLVDRLLSPVSPIDRLMLLTSLSFPAATSDVFWALLNGACLCIYDIRRQGGVAGFAGWLQSQEITCMRSPVAFFRYFLETMLAGLALPRLRLVVLSGDTLFACDVARARTLLPACDRITYRYSMSETGLVCLVNLPREVPIEDGIIPVGLPVPGKEVRLLDPMGSSLPDSAAQVGEIVVVSRYLAAEYWGQPEMTHACFVADPELPGRRLFLSGDLGRFRPDGSLELLGRRDYRLKIRGYRVEVAAVEAALLRLEDIEAATVIPQPDPSGEKSLVAYIVLRSGRDTKTIELRRRLAETLPDFMIPSRFELRDALPLTSNGKIDRQALADPARAAPAPMLLASSPNGLTEERIARIWMEVLRLEQVCRKDDFFSLGGHSLLAARVVARLNETFQLALPLIGFYQTPTIAGLAALIERGESATHSDDQENSIDLARSLLLLEAF